MTQARIAAHRQRPDAPSRFQSRRGAISVAFAIGSTALLGMGALATEAGIWLSSRRNAQNAADVAAYVGAVRLSLSGSTEATDAASQVVGRNGFTNTGTLSAAGDTRVTIDIGFVTPAASAGGAVGNFVTPAPTGSSANAVRVQIQQVQRIGLSQLINRTAPIAWGGAVAAIEVGGPACTLSIPPPNPSSQINGQTNLEGNSTIRAPNCLMASNYGGRKSINIQGSTDVVAAGLRASGQCYNCNNAALSGGYVSGAPRLEDPYARLNDDTSNPLLRRNANSGNLVENFNRSAPTRRTVNGRTEITLPVMTPTSTGRPVATDVGGNGTLQIGTNETLVLTPGTYYLFETSIKMSTGSASIECRGCSRGGPGVTLVFTGNNANKVGGMDITGGQFTLIAPGTTYGTPSVYDGIVIYRDNFGSTPNQNVFNIRGNTGVGDSNTLFGGIYSPTGGFSFEGTPSVNMTTDPSCIAVVAAEITFTGNSTANIDACKSNGTAVAQVKYVRLVQ